MTMVSIAVLLIILSGIGFYLAGHPGIFRPIRVMPPWSAVLLLGLSVLALAGNGMYLKLFARKFGLELRAKEWFGLAAVTAVGNYLTPFSGGVVARAAYLRHRHEFPYPRFLALLTANYLIAFAVISAAGIAVMISLYGTVVYSGPVLLFFAATLLAAALLLKMPSGPEGRGGLARRFLQPALEGLRVIRRDERLLWKLVAVTCLNLAVGALLYLTAFHAIGAAIPFRLALLIHLMTSFTVLVSITPGNLGIQEAAAGLAAALLGAGADTGLLASLLIRTATILCAFALGPIFSYLLSRELAGKGTGPGGEGRAVGTGAGYGGAKAAGREETP